MSSAAGKGLAKDHAAQSGVRAKNRASAQPAGPHDALLALQRAAGNRAVTSLLAGSSGRPLDSATRVEMESKFGADFGGVRIHSGKAAADVALRAGARAITAGHDIVFGEGFYAPASPSGKRLIAHELAHVIQQNRPGGRSASSAAAESEARDAGANVAGGHTTTVQGATPGGAQADPLSKEEIQKRIAENESRAADASPQEAQDLFQEREALLQQLKAPGTAPQAPGSPDAGAPAGTDRDAQSGGPRILTKQEFAAEIDAKFKKEHPIYAAADAELGNRITGAAKGIAQSVLPDPAVSKALAEGRDRDAFRAVLQQHDRQNPLNALLHLPGNVFNAAKSAGGAAGDLAYYSTHSDEPGAKEKIGKASVDFGLDTTNIALSLEGARGLARGVPAPGGAPTAVAPELAAAHPVVEPAPAPPAAAPPVVEPAPAPPAAAPPAVEPAPAPPVAAPLVVEPAPAPPAAAPPVVKPAKSAPRFTRLPPGPEPPPQTIGIKEEPLPEGTHKVTTTLKPRTSSLTDEELLRANMEKAGDPVAPGHAAHHLVPKKGGGAAGNRAREALERSDVPINDPDNGLSAPGTHVERGTVHEPGGAPYHGTIHTRPYYNELARRLEGVSDEAQARAILGQLEEDVKNGQFPQ